EPGDELSTKDFGESFDGNKERVFRVNPPFRVGRDSATGNHAMDVGMKEQVLTPGVKNGEETNLRSKMFRITRHLAECFGHRAEKQVVECRLILEDEGVQFMRQREDDVEVTGLKQFLLPCVHPSLT